MFQPREILGTTNYLIYYHTTMTASQTFVIVAGTCLPSRCCNDRGVDRPIHSHLTPHGSSRK
jgi:hypothetical protein